VDEVEPEHPRDAEGLLDEVVTRVGEILDVETVAMLMRNGERNELVMRGKHVRSLIGVPLLVGERTIGFLYVGSDTRRDFTDEDATVLQLVADRAALALDHARLFEAEREARRAAEAAAERVEQLQSITDVALSHLALDDDLLNEMLARVRDNLAVDTAAILLLDEESNELVARAGKGLEEEVERGVRIAVGGGFAGRIAATAAPVIVPDVDHANILNPTLRARGIRSLLGVPLVVEGRVIGVLHVGTLTERAFTGEDVTFLQLAGDRIAVALDHARLFEREHVVAATLQRSLLPEHLPRVPEIELAARYRPGGGEAELGGDWYDAVVLPSGEVGIALGDVVSRGLRAASVTAQLRNALRAYVLDGYAPAVLLSRLSGLTRSLERREMATLVYFVVDPASSKVVLASAGHPPPLVVEPDGTAHYLEVPQAVPLGALAHPEYEETEIELTPGSLVLAYTDGLVERRDLWVDEGMEALRQVAERLEGDVEQFCDAVLAEMLGRSSTSDDVALIAVRLPGAPDDALSLELAAEPGSLAVMRRALRSWLAARGLDPDESYEIVVATTEAAANAVEHAYGPVSATFRVDAHFEDGEVRIRVADSGRWRPPRGANRGRGTLLMQELMEGFEVVTGDEGTAVHMTRPLGWSSGAA
jgi:serine phosphatase RsbU (regulator of sigma subunit)/anti-sigma regulatory factor (Ser/Thr protein kinase)/putative methionine-R-sulfoxide reductase with GAF domain